MSHFTRVVLFLLAAPLLFSGLVGGAPTESRPLRRDNEGGVATFFYQNGVAGACGKVNPDSAKIAAMDSRTFKAKSDGSSALCGKQVEITNTKNNKKVTVTVADECPTCNNANSIDLSTGAFVEIATEEEGEVPISWKFV